MENDKTLLGLAFDQERIRFVEINKSPSLSISRAGEAALITPLDVMTVGDADQTAAQATAITAFLDQNKIAPRKTSLALDHSLLVLKRLQVDSTLNESEIRRHLEWEMEQFLTGPRDEYHVNFERLKGDGSPYQQLIVAAVRKTLIQHLTAVFERTPLKLVKIDIDLLSMIRSLKNAVDQIVPGLSVLISARENTLLMVLLRDGAYLSQQNLTLRPEQTLLTVQPSEAEEIAAFINEELLAMMDILGDEVLLKNVEQVFLTPSAYSHELLSALQASLRTADIISMEPLAKVHHSLDLDAQRRLQEKPDHYLPIIGMFSA